MKAMEKITDILSNKTNSTQPEAVRAIRYGINTYISECKEEKDRGQQNWNYWKSVVRESENKLNHNKNLEDLEISNRHYMLARTKSEAADGLKNFVHRLQLVELRAVYGLDNWSQSRAVAEARADEQQKVAALTQKKLEKIRAEHHQRAESRAAGIARLASDIERKNKLLAALNAEAAALQSRQDEAYAAAIKAGAEPPAVAEADDRRMMSLELEKKRARSQLDALTNARASAVEEDDAATTEETRVVQELRNTADMQKREGLRIRWNLAVSALVEVGINLDEDMDRLEIPVFDTDGLLGMGLSQGHRAHEITPEVLDEIRQAHAVDDSLDGILNEIKAAGFGHLIG